MFWAGLKVGDGVTDDTQALSAVSGDGRGGSPRSLKKLIQWLLGTKRHMGDLDKTESVDKISAAIHT